MPRFEIVTKPTVAIPWPRTIWIAVDSKPVNSDGKILLTPECVTPSQVKQAVDKLISDLERLRDHAMGMLPAIAA